jgi:acid stress chaperone HdeB
MAASSAHAQVTIDVSKITCRQMLHDTFTVPENIAYWLNGYYSAKRANTVFDVGDFKDRIAKVQDYCLHNEDVTVMKAAEVLFGVSK